MVMSLWQSHRQSVSGSFDEWETAPSDRPTVRSSQPT